ncbi:uncharacterized mitochondrial protein AtMg00810-like [Alnus glutinosa]|uniref:uncharacterized mitochondrial protein AtMg00810-like n=1 Tax=Alnus glutinosa TaxID=3517 RepID=UPI002D79DA3D|nr:uncharacterized mitochondrial protein AtMg00810-like [Alnus glutinosa]
MIITIDDSIGILELKQFLSQHFEMKNLGTLSYFLDLEISSSSGGYYFTQAKYISDMLSRANLTNCKTVDTSTELNVRLNLHDGEPLHDFTLYQHLVGSLFYLTVTRLDISYAVHQSPFELHASTNADWAGDPTNHHSTTGYFFLLGTSLVSWSSKKQSVVAPSSTEAEYRAFADTTLELLWLRWLFYKIWGSLQLHSVTSYDQFMDLFTKSHLPGQFRDFVSNLKMVSRTLP